MPYPDGDPHAEEIPRRERVFRGIAVGASIVGLLLFLLSGALVAHYRWGLVELSLAALGIAVLVGIFSLPYFILRLLKI